MEPWKKAIENHKILMKERTDPGFWADNIIESTYDLKTEKDWKIFYLYLTQSPKFFNKDNPVDTQTVGELDHIPVIPPYQDNQTVECIQNGNVQYIMVNTIPENLDDEKLCV